MTEPYASILEDDNWWEPQFLSVMIAALENRPHIALACGNERIWREDKSGAWTDTANTIWPPGDDVNEYPMSALDKCGSARLCNSSLVFRTAEAQQWRTPDEIPVDVTEHFRERVIPHPFILVHAPLVNYAETLHTYRTQGPGLWGEYQALLIGSVFQLAAPSVRRDLARRLWADTRTQSPQRGTVLLGIGLAQRSARELWNHAFPGEKFRFLLSTIRHPVATIGLFQARSRHASAWNFLLSGSFADFMAKHLTIPPTAS